MDHIAAEQLAQRCVGRLELIGCNGAVESEVKVPPRIGNGTSGNDQRRLEAVLFQDPLNALVVARTVVLYP